MRGSTRPDTRVGLWGLLDRYPFTIGVSLTLLLLFLFAGMRSNGWPIHPDLRLALGANVSDLLRAEPWRLLTSAFLHYDPFHLVLNLVAILFWGRLLEVHFGSARLWVLYVVCALAGNALSALWQELLVWQGLARGSTSCVGASGAVFGLLFLGLITAQRAPERFGSWLFLLRSWIGLSFILAFLSGGPVDHANHLGGALTGILLAYLFPPRPGEDLAPAWGVWALVLAAGLLASFARVVWSLRSLHP
ncbi:MAG: rhomboid family intramembrane serine protease [Planctomycetota bacterium]